MTGPWLSVLMPTYNGAAYLRAALDSVVAQGDPEIECIAVDDGSTDGTLEILEAYRDRLRLEIVVRPHGGNWVTNTNLALDRARGAFACLLHQDDVWMPGRLARLAKAIEDHPEVDLILHPVWFIGPDGQRLGRWSCPLPAEPRLLDSGQVLPRLLVQNFIAIPAPMFRTALARDVGGLDPALWNTADWDFWLKLAARGTALHVPEPYACFRVHPEAQTNRRSIDIADFRHQHDLVLDRHLPMSEAGEPWRVRARRCAELSIAVNMVLASRYHGLSPDLVALAASALRAGPLGIWRYLSYSRILERAGARLKVHRRMSAVASMART